MPPTKVLKTSGTNATNAVTRVGRVCRGGLKDMPTMPLDILLEIFKLMSPKDLLMLARTSRDFRAFLTSRQSAPYWRETRKNVKNLPPCPPFLSEPAYANLLFCTHCHGCAKPNIQTIIWPFFARYCPGCRAAQLLDGSEVRSLLASVYPHVPYKDVSPLLGVMCSAVTVTPNKPASAIWRRDDVTMVLDSWSQSQDGAEKVAFVIRTRKRLDEARAVARVCEHWYTRHRAEESRAREKETRPLKEERLAAIIARLRQDGFGAEVDFLTPTHFKQYNVVWRAKKLTEGEWLKVWEVLAPVISDARADRERMKRQCEEDERRRERIEALRREKEEREHCYNVLKTAISAFDSDMPEGTLDIQPRFVDYAFMPEIKELLKGPRDQKLTKDDFLPLLPGLATRWQSDLRAALTTIVQDHLSLPADGSAHALDLAIAYFHCKFSLISGACKSKPPLPPLRYPDMLGHRCIQKTTLTVSEAIDAYGKHILSHANNLHAPLLSNVGLLSVSPHALDLLSVLGKDPTRTTIAELQSDHSILECKYPRCSPEGRSLHTWQSAIEHWHDAEVNYWAPFIDQEEDVKEAGVASSAQAQA